MPIARPSSNEQGSRRDHDSRDKRGQVGNQQKVLQDSGHDSLPDPLRWRSDLAVDQLRLYKIDHPQPLVPFTRAPTLATAAAQLLGE